MAAGYAPRIILSQMVTVDCTSDSDGEDYVVPIEPEPVAQKLVEHMREEGWPKALVRVKAQSGGPKTLVRVKAQSRGHETNGAVIVAMLSALLAAGRRVFVASPAHEDRLEIRRANNAILEDLRCRARQHRWGIKETGDITEVREYERKVRRYEDSCVDVIIGIHAIVEGFDWPLCSHSYFIGVPHGLLPVIQGLGRSVRGRLTRKSGRLVSVYDGYPKPWEDRSKLVFITADDPNVKDALRAQMLETCSYLQTFQRSEILGAFRRSLTPLRIESDDADEIGDVDMGTEDVQTLLVPEERAREINSAWLDARQILEERVTHPSKGYSLRDMILITKRYLAVKNGSEEEIINSKQLHADIREVILLNDPRVCKKIQDIPDRIRASGKDPREGFYKELRRILEEFERDTSDAPLTQSEKMMLTLALTSDGITKWGNRVGNQSKKENVRETAADPYSAIQKLVRSR
jgi:hypothetical protein